MKKIIKKWGDSLIISLTSEDARIYNLKKGDVVDIEIAKVRKNVRKEEN